MDIGIAANDPSIEHPLDTSDPNPIVSAEKEPDETVEGEAKRILTTKNPHDKPYLLAENIPVTKMEYKAGECTSGEELGIGKIALAKTGCPGFAA